MNALETEKKRLFAKTKLDHLTQRFAELRYALLEADKDRPATVYRLPYRKDPLMLKELGEREPDMIIPTVLTGIDARKAAYSLFTKIKRHGDQDLISVERMPGMIACSSATLSLFERINDAKTQLSDAIKDIADQRHTRRKEMLLLQNGFSLTEATRIIKVLDRQPHKLTFGWRKSKTSTEPTSVELARKHIHAHRAAPPTESFDLDTWMTNSDEALDALNDLHDQEQVAFISRRPAFPIAVLIEHAGDKDKTPTANLPFVYEDDGTPPVGKPLPAFNVVENERSDRSFPRVLDPNPISAPLRLFRYAPPRKYEGKGLTDK